MFLSPAFCFCIGAFVAGDIARINPLAGLFFGTVASLCFLFLLLAFPPTESMPPMALEDVIGGLGLLLAVGLVGAVLGTCVGYASTYEE